MNLLSYRILLGATNFGASDRNLHVVNTNEERNAVTTTPLDVVLVKNGTDEKLNINILFSDGWEEYPIENLNDLLQVLKQNVVNINNYLASIFNVYIVEDGHELVDIAEPDKNEGRFYLIANTNELYIYVFEEFKLIGGAGGTELYTNDTPMPEAVGGYDAGTVFENKTQQEMWDGLLQRYQVPTISYIGSLFTTYELGVILLGDYATSYSITNSENIKENSDVVSTSTEPKITAPNSFASASGAITVSIDSLLLSSVGSIACSITGVNSKDVNFITTKTIFKRRYFYSTIGAVAASPTTSVAIRELPKSFLGSTNGGTFNISVPTGTQELSFYAPSGKNINVIDTGNLNNNVTEAFVKTTLDIDHGNSVVSSYDKHTIFLGVGGFPADTTFNISIS